MELSKDGNLIKLTGKEKDFSIRKSIVIEAQKNVIKPTAGKFGMSKNTVLLFLKRFLSGGNEGLIDRRKGPKHIPHKTSAILETKIIKCRNLASCYVLKD